MKAFLKASLAWLGLGVALGVAMAAWPAWTAYRAAHMHMNLLGFVAMMIFGVAYHVIPRFTGHALYSRRLAGLHWWFANVGLALFAGGLIARMHWTGGGVVMLVGGVLSALSAYFFIYNLWRTIDGQPVATMVGIAAAKR